MADKYIKAGCGTIIDCSNYLTVRELRAALFDIEDQESPVVYRNDIGCYYPVRQVVIRNIMGMQLIAIHSEHKEK